MSKARSKMILKLAATVMLAAIAGSPSSGQEQVKGAAKPAGDPGRGDEPGAGGVKPVVMHNGEEAYRGVCQACHMIDAKGGQGAAVIPALANNPRLAQAAYPITLVAKGRGAMPWFNDTLTPEQVAEVVGYIRTHFGNKYTAPVTAADVTKVAGPFPAPPR